MKNTNKNIDEIFREIADEIVKDRDKKDKANVKINYASCPDIIVGEDGVFWFSKNERKNHIEKLKIENIDKSQNKKHIVIVLESPHKDEYEDENFINPALGKTGRMLQEFFTDYNLKNLFGKEYLKNGYQVILINSIQYQCSLGESPEIYRDKVWRKMWDNNIVKKKFKERVISYCADIIINLCTKSNEKPEERKGSVQTAIEEVKKNADKNIILYEGNHPSSWASNFDSISLI